MVPCVDFVIIFLLFRGLFVDFSYAGCFLVSFGVFCAKVRGRVTVLMLRACSAVLCAVLGCGFSNTSLKDSFLLFLLLFERGGKGRPVTLSSRARPDPGLSSPATLVGEEMGEELGVPM